MTSKPEYQESNYPTPYAIRLQKVLANGVVEMQPHPAPSPEQAMANLAALRAEYYESGGWGGPG